jgi:hypothetical protein
MRRTVLFLLVLAVLTAAYSVWPFIALFELVEAVRVRNLPAVAERVDATSLSRSLAQQVMQGYARVSGAPASPLTQQLVFSFGYGLADPLVQKMVTPDAVSDLIQVGWPVAVLGGKPDGLPGIDYAGNAFQLYLASEYGFDEFRLWLPVDKPLQEQYRLTLRREGLRWKLIGVVLPEAVRDKLGQEIVKATSRR